MLWTRTFARLFAPIAMIALAACATPFRPSHADRNGMPLMAPSGKCRGSTAGAPLR